MNRVVINNNDEVMKIIEKYEYISLRTCIKCGKTAYGVTEGWITPLCKECFNKSTFRIIRPYYNEDNSWYGYTCLIRIGRKPCRHKIK